MGIGILSAVDTYGHSTAYEDRGNDKFQKQTKRSGEKCDRGIISNPDLLTHRLLPNTAAWALTKLLLSP